MTTPKHKISTCVVTPHRRKEFSAVATAALAGDELLPETVVVSFTDLVELLSTIVAFDGCLKNLALISMHN